MKKVQVPVPYIIALVLGIVIVVMLGYWFFILGPMEEEPQPIIIPDCDILKRIGYDHCEWNRALSQCCCYYHMYDYWYALDGCFEIETK